MYERVHRQSDNFSMETYNEMSIIGKFVFCCLSIKNLIKTWRYERCNPAASLWISLNNYFRLLLLSVNILTLLSLISSLVVLDLGKHLSKFTTLPHVAANCLSNIHGRLNVCLSVLLLLSLLYLHCFNTDSPTRVVLNMYFPLYESSPYTLLRQQSRTFTANNFKREIMKKCWKNMIIKSNYIFLDISVFT